MNRSRKALSGIVIAGGLGVGAVAGGVATILGALAGRR